MKSGRDPGEVRHSSTNSRKMQTTKVQFSNSHTNSHSHTHTHSNSNSNSNSNSHSNTSSNAHATPTSAANSGSSQRRRNKENASTPHRERQVAAEASQLLHEGLESIKNHDWSHAISALKAAIELYPNNPEAYIHRGIAQMELNATRSALKVTQLPIFRTSRRWPKSGRITTNQCIYTCRWHMPSWRTLQRP